MWKLARSGHSVARQRAEFVCNEAAAGLIATGSMPDLARQPRPGFPGQTPQHLVIEAVCATWAREGQAAKPMDWTFS